MKKAKYLITILLISGLHLRDATAGGPVMITTESDAVVAQFARELRKDPAFSPTDKQWSDLMTDLQQKIADGDPRASAALAAAPQFLAYEKSLSAKAQISDAEALRLYQLDLPLLLIYLPADHSPLTDLQAISINLYTNTTYGPVNGDLAYFHEQPYRFKTFVQVLDSALSCLPDFAGTVYHVETMSQQDIGALKPGTSYHYSTYVSTSSERIGFAGNAVLKIQAKDGKDIANFSRNPQEHEVLLHRGVTLQTVSAPVFANGIYSVEMNEL